MEIRKASNFEGYPLELKKQEVKPGNMSIRACTQGRLIIPGVRPIMKKTCLTDAIRLWNSAPPEVTSASTLATAKCATKTFVKTLPT